MPQPHSVSQPAPSRGAALVAVDGRVYPLTRASITARAEGGLAATTLTQEFRNPFDEPLEVTYTLPLPADGAVLGYCIRVGDRVIRGEIEKRQEATARFEKAIFEGRTAALLDQERDDTFTQRLGAIPPGQSVLLEIEVLHPLGFAPAEPPEPAQWEYRFPTVVGVRYEGEPGRVRDSDRLDVDRAREGDVPTRVELDLRIADGPPASLAVVSSTHDIRSADLTGATCVSFRTSARLDRDLVVRWTACGDRTGVRLVEGGGRPGDDGRYALLTLTPPAAPDVTFERDLTVLLDASGSMSGGPLDWAKTVVKELITSLDGCDRFEVLAFASETIHLTPGLVGARSQEVTAAFRRLDALQAGGGTEMAQALTRALKPLRKESQRQVVLVTDGFIGFEKQVTGEVLHRLPVNSRVHTVGVGAAPNRSLTRGVARAGRGVEVFATDETSAAAAARRLCRATARPVLTELVVHGDAAQNVAPARPGDVLAGQPLVMTLELKPEGGTLEVSGRQAGSKDVWIWRMTLPSRVAGSHGSGDEQGPVRATTLPLGALYGREIISDLELEAAAGLVDQAQVDSSIEAAGLRHRIVSTMTSLVAIAEEPSVDPKLARRRERLPVEVPAFVSAEFSGLLGSGSTMNFVGYGSRPSLNLALRPAQIMGPPMAAAVRQAYKDPSKLEELLKQFPASPPQTPPVQEVRIIGARALRIAADSVVLEFEAPFDGFVLPDGEVNVWIDGAKWRIARVVPGDGSSRGPYRAGVVVMMALRIDHAPDLKRVHRIDVRWLLRPAEPSATHPERQLVMSVEVEPQDARAR